MSNTNFINYVTEDNILAQTLCVYEAGQLTNDVRRFVEETDLREYFEKFGKLTSIIYSPFGIFEKSVCEQQFVLLIYKKSECVSRVLNQTIHILNGRQLVVKVAPSWVQPNFSEDTHVKSYLVDVLISNANIPGNSVLRINDDCILYIFWLLNLQDQIRLSRLCSRLDAIGEIAFRKTKKINFNDIEFHTPMEIKNTFRKIGKNIEQIKFLGAGLKMSSTLYAAVFTPLCPNLKILKFNNIYVHRSVYKALMPVLKDLESIVLRNCKISDDIVIMLKDCTKLRKLEISFATISGLGLNTLSNTIMDLNLFSCSEIETEHFINLCKVAKLKKLDISFTSLNGLALEYLRKFESLEAIALSKNLETNNLSSIANIPNLKDLHIRCWYGLDDNFFQMLERQKSNTLERLRLDVVEDLNEFQINLICSLKNLKEISIPVIITDDFLKILTNSKISLTRLSVSRCRNISDTILLNFVEKSKDIQIIDITSCKQFGLSFVLKLIEILKNLKRRNRLELIVTGTNIIRILVEAYHINTNFEHLLKLTYTYV